MVMRDVALRTRAAVAATIRAERSARNWTRADLEARSGVKEQSIGRYERNVREPGVSDLAHLAEAFGLTLVEFVQLADERAGRLDEERDDEPKASRAG